MARSDSGSARRTSETLKENTKLAIGLGIVVIGEAVAAVGAVLLALALKGLSAMAPSSSQR